MALFPNFFSEIPECESLIEAGFVYAVENKPISAGHTKTGAYVGENRKLDAMFRVKCPHEIVETNAPAPSVQLQSLRAVLTVIAYSKWDFRVMDAPLPF